MNNEDLKNKLSALFPTAVFEDGGEWINLYIEPQEIHSVCDLLKNTSELSFDYLFCLTCIDWKTHLTMVYHLTSTIYRHSMVLKVKLDARDPLIPTVCNHWRTAEFHEREVYELFGVVFQNHPDLRKLLLTDDFIGFPLRKDFEDPINMIKL